MASSIVHLRDIESDDLLPVGAFLHQHLNSRLSTADWAASIVPAWHGTKRDAGGGYGHLLADDSAIVGVQLVFSSLRDMASGPTVIHNLGALCVLPSHRAHSVRLLRAAWGSRARHLTDFSPSGAVIGMNERSGFTRLETATALVLAVPQLPWRFAVVDRACIVVDPEKIAHRLTGRELEIFRDHRDARAGNHLIVERGSRFCYVMWRRERRKDLPMFASLLHASDPTVLTDLLPALSRHLFIRHRVVATLVEHRFVTTLPRWSVRLPSPRPKMFRSPTLVPDEIDYLYSELTSVAW